MNTTPITPTRPIYRPLQVHSRKRVMRSGNAFILRNTGPDNASHQRVATTALRNTPWTKDQSRTLGQIHPGLDFDSFGYGIIAYSEGLQWAPGTEVILRGFLEDESIAPGYSSIFLYAEGHPPTGEMQVGVHHFIFHQLKPQPINTSPFDQTGIQMFWRTLGITPTMINEYIAEQFTRVLRPPTTPPLELPERVFLGHRYEEMLEAIQHTPRLGQAKTLFQDEFPQFRGSAYNHPFNTPLLIGIGHDLIQARQHHALLDPMWAIAYDTESLPGGTEVIGIGIQAQRDDRPIIQSVALNAGTDSRDALSEAEEKIKARIFGGGPA